MKKYLSLGFCFVAAAILSAGCTKSVRYSPEEIKDYPPHIQEQIEKGEVSLGMTKQQVRYAWGYPSQINILSASEDGKAREEWIYSKKGLVFIFLDKRLLFVDGKVADIYPDPSRSQQQ